MNPIILLEKLEEFVTEATKDIKLQVRGKPGEYVETKAPAVYKMRLPKKDDEIKRIPYILLQIVKGTDDQKDMMHASGACQIRIVIACYAEDADDGAYEVLTVIQTLREALERAGILGEQFDLHYPVEWIVYPDDTAPYFLGEMMTEWSVPAYERREDLL